MKAIPILLVSLTLAGCGGGGSSPPTLPPPPALISGVITSSGAWAVTQGSVKPAIVNGGFDLPQCASASVCWISYVEAPMFANIASAAAVTLNYAVIGDNPTFTNDSPGNNCGGPAQLSLFLHRANDSGALTARQFSEQRTTLEIGAPQAFTVPIDQSRWINVSGRGFGDTLANIGSVGFVLGGGCFSGHGVAVSKGSARFIISNFLVQ